MKIMPHRIAKKQRRFRSRQLKVIVLVATLMIMVAGIGLTQPADPTPATPQTTTASPQPSNSESIPSDQVFFADILVRGQPVFQVGSLSDLSASERAQIVNRRIASILAQSEAGARKNLPKTSATLTRAILDAPRIIQYTVALVLGRFLAGQQPLSPTMDVSFIFPIKKFLVP